MSKRRRRMTKPAAAVRRNASPQYLPWSRIRLNTIRWRAKPPASLRVDEKLLRREAHKRESTERLSAATTHARPPALLVSPS